MESEQTTAPLTGKPGHTAKATYSGPPRWRSSRFILAYVIMMGNATVFLQRVSFSMVIVCMINHTALDLAHDLHGLGDRAPGTPNHTHLAIADLGQLGHGVGQSGVGQSGVGQSGVGQSRQSDVGQSRQSDVGQSGVGQSGHEVGQSGVGQSGQSGVGQTGRSGSPPVERIGLNQSVPTRGGDLKQEAVYNVGNGSVSGVGLGSGSGATGGEEGLEESVGECDRLPSDAESSEQKEDGPFVWDKETQGLLLGAVYWGYMSSQIVAGYFIYFFGARRVCVVSMLAMSAFTMLCPPAAYWSPWAVFVLRVAVGLCTSFAIPAMYSMWGPWAPTAERATLVSLSFSGQNIANSVAFPTAALLCKYGFAGGWPSVFYVSGLLGVTWCVAWMLVVSDSPETLSSIHPDERDYIVANRGNSYAKGEKIAVPWRQIFTSMAFWAIAAGHVTFTWGLFLFMSNLPLYMYEVMNFDIKSNGFYSMMPYIALGCVQVVAGFLSDVVVKHNVISLFWARRLFSSLSNLVPAVCVVIMSFLDCTHVAAVMSLLVMSVGFTGFAFSAFLVNPFDIAPRYAISITSVTNTLACIPGILTPYVVAEVTTDKTREQWQIIFFITAAIYVCGTIFFCVFVQTSLQPWAVPTPEIIEVDPLHSAADHKHDREGQLTVEQSETETLCERPINLENENNENQAV